MENNKKLDFISGFKGVLCIIVLIHHFMLVFYPDLVNGITDTTTNTIKNIALSPFNIFGYGGALAVAFFFIISGFLITYIHYSSNNTINYGKKIVKRFFNLLIPITISIIISFYIAKIFRDTGFLNKEFYVRSSYYNNLSFNVIDMFKEAFYRSIGNGDATYNPPLWTMKTELFGSILTFIFLHFFGNNKNRKYLYIVLILIFFRTLYIYFIIGIIIGDLYKNKKEVFNFKIYTKILLFILSVYLCGHTYLNSQSDSYKYLKFGIELSVDSVTFSRYLGSTLFFILMLSSNFIKKVLTVKPIMYISKFSLEIYILHWVILYTISIYVVSRLYIIFNNYLISVIIGLQITIVILYIFCLIYKKLFGKISKKISNNIVKILD